MDEWTNGRKRMTRFQEGVTGLSGSPEQTTDWLGLRRAASVSTVNRSRVRKPESAVNARRVVERVWRYHLANRFSNARSACRWHTPPSDRSSRFRWPGALPEKETETEDGL